MKTRYINGIIIHCAATPNGRWHNVHEIDKWHQERGFARDDMVLLTNFLNTEYEAARAGLERPTEEGKQAA